MLNCDSSSVLKIVLLAKNIINLIQIFGPIILIIWAILDIVKLVSGSLDNEQIGKIKKKIINRFLSLIAIFIIPSIVNVVMTSIGQENIESTVCWINANEQYIEKKKIEEEKLEASRVAAEMKMRTMSEEQRRKAALEKRHNIVFAKAITAAPVGEAAGIDLNQRMNYLFPEGIPTSKSTMEEYLEQIEVPIMDIHGNQSMVNLTVHKKLASEIKAIFEEMVAIKFPVKDTYGYSWRRMASGIGSLSHHSYGVAIDVNASSNGAPYTGWGYNPGSDPYSVTQDVVSIWKKHGFYWGGDWSGYYNDPMHFTYTNH